MYSHIIIHLWFFEFKLNPLQIKCCVKHSRQVNFPTLLFQDLLAPMSVTLIQMGNRPVKSNFQVLESSNCPHFPDCPQALNMKIKVK